MKIPNRFSRVFAAAMFMVCVAPSLYAQTGTNNVVASPGYAKMPPVSLNSIRTIGHSPVLVYPAGAATSKGHIVFDQNGANVSG
ncbi:MAG: hypothetical protein ACRD4H_07815 [Candidatus Acidiferrales bacterium]